MRNFETTHCTPLPASEFHSPWRLWTRMDGWEATIGRSDWPVVRVCSCDGVNVLLILHQISFPPPYDRFIVMCSVAVMASGKICSWKKKKIATFPLTPPKNPVKYGTSMEFSVLLFSFVLVFFKQWVQFMQILKPSPTPSIVPSLAVFMKSPVETCCFNLNDISLCLLKRNLNLYRKAAKFFDMSSWTKIYVLLTCSIKYAEEKSLNPFVHYLIKKCQTAQRNSAEDKWA